MGDDNTFPITTLEKAADNWCHVMELLGQCTEQTLGRRLWLLLLWFCRWEPRESWEAWSVWASLAGFPALRSTGGQGR